MPPPEKLKRKLLTPDADGRTRVTLYALSTILRMAGGGVGGVGGGVGGIEISMKSSITHVALNIL